MYLAVDVGATKTLLACFSADGKLISKFKFATPAAYEDWLNEFEAHLPELKCDDWQAGTLAIPGRVDRAHGIGLSFGNLDWQHVPIQADAERITKCPLVIENDAKAAGLSEALLIKKDFKNVLYITIGTGIGVAYTTNGVIDLRVDDRGGHVMMLNHHGKHRSWESFASGRAIVRRFGKKASEITDTDIWKTLARDFASGLLDLVAAYEPDVIVIGGGVGSHFNRFGDFLEAELKKYQTPLLHIPPIKEAKHAEDAVLFGCYELAKAKYGSSAKKTA